jgi:hypothetical protein
MRPNLIDNRPAKGGIGINDGLAKLGFDLARRIDAYWNSKEQLWCFSQQTGKTRQIVYIGAALELEKKSEQSGKSETG